jgi:hypothetical protein
MSSLSKEALVIQELIGGRMILPLMKCFSLHDVNETCCMIEPKAKAKKEKKNNCNGERERDV